MKSVTMITERHSINDTRYTDDTVLLGDTENKLQEIQEKVLKEMEKKEISIYCGMYGCLQMEEPTMQRAKT